MMRTRFALATTQRVQERCRDLLVDWLYVKWHELERVDGLEMGSHEIAEGANRLSIREDGSTGSWSLELSQLEPCSPPRRWRTTVALSATPEKTLFDVQNGYFALPGRSPVPTTPFFVRAIADELAASDGGLPILATARVVGDDQQFDKFIDMLLLKARRLPVVAVTPLRSAGHSTGRYAFDVQNLARQLHCVAHVVQLEGDTTYLLSDSLGDALTVYNGGVRIYEAGFHANAESQDHPLSLPPQAVRRGEMDEHRGFEGYVRALAFASGAKGLGAMESSLEEAGG